MPDFRDWREGEIVLVHRAAETAGLAIQASQAMSLSAVTREGAICSYAAIYIGAGTVVDATRGAGVSAQSVWNFRQHRAIWVRRLSDPSSNFVMNVAGWSMRDAGIADGDELVVDRGVAPEDGRIVVANVDGELTVKRLRRTTTAWLLQAANPPIVKAKLGDEAELAKRTC